MTTIFTAKIVRDASKGRTRLLDGGCGKGTHALYLAGLNPQRSVHAYDVSSDAIEQANRYKQAHRVTNVEFSVANHDDFQAPRPMDMIYTCESLVGADEIPRNIDPLQASEDIVKRRLSKFRETLTHEGIYVFTWGAAAAWNGEFVKIAEACGLRHVDTKEGDVYDYTDDWPTRPIFKAAMIFRRS